MTTITARTVAATLASNDLRCAPEPGALAARIVDADECDSCLDCEWTIAGIVAETGCDELVAERAVGLYRAALRAAAQELLDAAPTYVVAFSGASTEDDYRALAQLAEEPLPLRSVIAACAERGVRAILRDDAGFQRGWVRADGDYRLT
jgi:hypothetical protein